MSVKPAFYLTMVFACQEGRMHYMSDAYYFILLLYCLSKVPYRLCNIHSDLPPAQAKSPSGNLLYSSA